MGFANILTEIIESVKKKVVDHLRLLEAHKSFRRFCEYQASILRL